MARITMTEALKSFNDPKVSGVAEEIVSVDELLGLIPVTPINGSSITVNGETTAGDIEEIAVNAAITAINGSVVTPTTFNWTAYVGDALVDAQVVAAAGAGVPVTDIMAREVTSKANHIGRKVKEDFGKNTATRGIKGFNALASTVLGASSGRDFSLELMDELLDKVQTTNGAQADFIVSTPKARRKFFSLVRALGGTGYEYVTMNDRRYVTYNGILWLINDNLPTTEVATTDASGAITGGALQSIYAGRFDDGSQKVGLSLIHPNTVPGGVQVTPLGQSQGYFAHQTRVSLMIGNALFNQKALVRLASIN